MKALQPIAECRDLSTAVEAAAKRYGAQARCARTRETYSAAWERFSAWCRGKVDRRYLRASRRWQAGIAALADGQDGPPRSASTVNQHLSAVIQITGRRDIASIAGIR